MATKVTMPQLGESVTEGTIGRWLVKEGDHVNKYDPLCEVITDKVNAEVPSSYSGTVAKIVAQEGETVEVGGLICYIEEDGEGAADQVADAEQGKGDQQAEAHKVQDDKDEPSMKRRYSPAVLKLAQEHDIDLEQVEGTGRGGRITRKDLLKLIESGNIPTKAARAAAEAKAAPTEQTRKEEQAAAQPAAAAYQAEQRAAQPAHIQARPGDTQIPVSAVRRAIANKMVQSKHEAPHAWTMVEVDVTELVKYREKVKHEFKQKEGINLTYLPFFIKATVEALKEFPMINSQWAGDKIIQKKEINISIAVATEDALFVPVIKNADEKSILGLARAIDDLARRTREGKLTQDDIQGGTFTVNNTGSFGSVLSQPIINYPQAAILSVEAIVKRPVVKNDMIAVRDMVNLCLSLDHRILDGLICGRFLQSIKQKLEAMGEGMSLY
ncbi:catalytic domain-containing protein of components of various dehydrogenase complexes [Caldalkalibacillus thermarum TA2.A1]|uniref:Dihydrolipoamide acetyltransferase component of pyruvate dehydrogenase complex n=1 Tax=Caldalkalibacillus thermarum (strain TA2.A1) TaxID=986075 RepID=F5L5H5_CALTT|nr:dihydrolipoamide acetyltransferase family protein [Caldalkalibacillus thermarum]EGL83409.1 catalytic domain-containing protein of components of various dehydrogenase complexes [Caldalkalibacillus thermarum TA2.A1]QZT32674.1 2-oxo acid dehydrogenase subunit E2 [Caldalkalibacillus thermarum TA2.A1]